jgi:hypothetical protein
MGPGHRHWHWGWAVAQVPGCRSALASQRRSSAWLLCCRCGCRGCWLLCCRCGCRGWGARGPSAGPGVCTVVRLQRVLSIVPKNSWLKRLRAPTVFMAASRWWLSKAVWRLPRVAAKTHSEQGTIECARSSGYQACLFVCSLSCFCLLGASSGPRHGRAASPPGPGRQCTQRCCCARPGGHLACVLLATAAW